MSTLKSLTKEELDKLDPLIRHDHPRFVIQQIFQLIKSIGTREFLRSPKYGGERDKFIGSMFAFYVRKIQNREQYVQKPREFPDIEISAFSDRKIRERPLDNAHVEITSVPESAVTFDDALKTVKDSKLNKLYEKDKTLVLLIFINNKYAPSWIKQFSNYFLNSTDGFGEVYAIYLRDFNTVDAIVYEVVSLRPYGTIEVLKLNEEMDKREIQHPYIERFGRKLPA